MGIACCPALNVDLVPEDFSEVIAGAYRRQALVVPKAHRIQIVYPYSEGEQD